MQNPADRSRRGFDFQSSGPGATRTRDLLLRRQALYPTELRTLISGGEIRCLGGFPHPPSRPLAPGGKRSLLPETLCEPTQDSNIASRGEPAISVVLTAG